MPLLDASHVHVNRLLTNVGIRYTNKDYIADRIFPKVQVNNETDVYASWDQSHWYRDEARAIAPGDTAPFASAIPTLTNTYQCINYAHRTPIPRRIAQNADPALQLQATMTELEMQRILIARERRVASMVNTSGNWTNSATLSTTDLWSDTTNSKPVTKIDSALDTVRAYAGGQSGNTMVMGGLVWKYLKRHPDITYLIFGPGANRDLITTPELVARAFSLDNVYVGEALYTGDEEDTDETGITYSRIWGAYCWIGYVSPAPSLVNPSAGYIFQQSYRVRSWYDDASDTDWIECSGSEDEVVTCANAGYLYTLSGLA